MDEVELTKRQAKGDRARELLENDTLKEAFATLHDDYLTAWKRTLVRDTDARERLWQAVQIVALVQDHLKQWVSDGKVAKADMAILEAGRKARGKR